MLKEARKKEWWFAKDFRLYKIHKQLKKTIVFLRVQLIIVFLKKRKKNFFMRDWRSDHIRNKETISYQAWIMPPFAINEKFILVLPLRQINNSYEISMTLHHGECFPASESSTDINLFSSSFPFENCWQYLTVSNFSAFGDGIWTWSLCIAARVL